MEVAVIDLETVPAPWWLDRAGKERVELIAKLTEEDRNATLDATQDPLKKFPPLPAHLPVVYGCWSVRLEQGIPLSYVDYTVGGYIEDQWERTALNNLGEVIANSRYVVTYNGRGFDMPLLQLRALTLGVPWKFWEERRHRYPNYRKPLRHIDLLDQLTDYGASRMMKLDDIASMINYTKPGSLAGKGVMDGSKVAETMRQPDGLGKVVEYCTSDVKMTLQLFLRWLYVCSEGQLEDVVAWLAQLSVSTERWIFKVVDNDMQEIDVGPFETEAEAQQASKKHIDQGLTASNVIKIDMNYKLKTGE